MPDRRIPTRAGLAIALAVLACGLAAASAPAALAVPGPGHECDAEALPTGADDACENGGTGGGGLDLGLLAAIGGGVLVAGAVGVGLAFLVIRRRAAPPLNPEPVDAGDWWTCRTCGRNNVVGSARCYACGAWQR